LLLLVSYVLIKHVYNKLFEEWSRDPLMDRVEYKPRLIEEDLPALLTLIGIIIMALISWLL